MTPKNTSRLNKSTTKGTLYIVPTPIGNLSDLSERAIEILSTVDAWLVEDTRHSGLLQKHLNLHKTMMPLHRFNEQKKNNEIIQKLSEGQNLALMSDAGTPLIHDPGHLLVASTHEANIPIVPLPGPCALTTALSAAGMPSDGFIFGGFLPEKTKQRQDKLKTLAHSTYTLVFYEAPHRLLKTLHDMQLCFGETRTLCLAKELTKWHETLIKGNIKTVIESLTSGKYLIKGEWVLVVAGNPNPQISADDKAIQNCLNTLIPKVGEKEAIMLTTKIMTCKKNKAYDLMLQQKKLNERNN